MVLLWVAVTSIQSLVGSVVLVVRVAKRVAVDTVAFLIPAV